MHVSLGAALENLLLAAPANGYTAKLQLLPSPGQPLHVASVALAPGSTRRSQFYEQIPHRHADRTAYTAQAVPAGALAQMASPNRAATADRVRQLATGARTDDKDPGRYHSRPIVVKQTPAGTRNASTGGDALPKAVGVLGIVGALAIWTALLDTRRSHGVRLILLVVGALPFALATWWSIVTPLIALLVLTIGPRAIRPTHADPHAHHRSSDPGRAPTSALTRAR